MAGTFRTGNPIAYLFRLKLRSHCVERRDREYRAGDYSVRIESIFREVVSVIYKRQRTTHN
jgi:hypothetical protein